ncbi:MAG: L,D-transpeptidase family protein [Aquimonas sp.]|nr:L,D-transpeptidase family protein [Aquimonas sp.]
MSRPRPRPGVLGFLLFCWLLLPPVLSFAQDPAAELALRLGAPGSALVIDGLRLRDAEAVRRFYAARDHAPAWTGRDCARALVELSEAIELADTHGLDPDDYHRAALSGLALCDSDREIVASDAFMMLAAHLAGGRIDPVSVEPTWTARHPDLDPVALLERALAEGRVAATLEALAPADPLYGALREALTQLRAVEEAGGWPSPSAGPSLREGDQGARVVEVRMRLAAEGLTAVEAVEPELFDSVLVEAVRAFQSRANLEVDGVVGRQTLAELGKGTDARIAQVRANLERLRWLPADLGRRHLLVDIADFRLEAREDGRTVRVHRVIVGRDQRQSPSFSAPMTYLVLNPWWEVPRRLAVQDKLPQFKRDPAAVTRLGFEVIDATGRAVDPTTLVWNDYSARDFPFRLRQRPGPDNALGEVKLMLPNRHDVYLHDTPSRGLFARTRRDFSSGCIRVEDALGLAEWVLEGSGWDRERIDAAAATDTPIDIRLRAPLPVHLVYRTAALDAEGGLRLLADPYGRDPPLATALQRAAPR